MNNPFKKPAAPDVDAKTTILEAAPESARWNPVPGSAGHKAPVSASEDEDDEGRSTDEKLVEAGVAEAELEQLAQAARVAAKKDL